MSLSIKKLLQEYFSVDDLKDVLCDIGEPVSGNKSQLVTRITNNWKEHNRDNYELLDFLDQEQLEMICYYYNTKPSGEGETSLKNSVKRIGLLDSRYKKRINSNLISKQKNLMKSIFKLEACTYPKLEK